MAQLVSRHSCVADRLPVVVRFPAGPRVRLKTVDPPKGNGLGQKNPIGDSPVFCATFHHQKLQEFDSLCTMWCVPYHPTGPPLCTAARFRRPPETNPGNIFGKPFEQPSMDPGQARVEVRGGKLKHIINITPRKGIISKRRFKVWRGPGTKPARFLHHSLPGEAKK